MLESLKTPNNKITPLDFNGLNVQGNGFSFSFDMSLISTLGKGVYTVTIAGTTQNMLITSMSGSGNSVTITIPKPSTTTTSFVTPMAEYTIFVE
jgi:hypothetical protein